MKNRPLIEGNQTENQRGEGTAGEVGLLARQEKEPSCFAALCMTAFITNSYSNERIQPPSTGTEVPVM